ncbi:MAG: NAD-dependent deacylase [Tannerellaceae bacterium]|jgi:NAD-dependent deacetylase|nr:NAD-dependent deacylase [Tannerellaceae bacterium]
MKKLVVLSGAGMSAESGISTFRDSNGLWEKYKVEDVATPEAFDRMPEVVLDFYNQRRRQLLECKPNAGHIGLAKLEKDFDVHVITQNVDNLHERAGSSKVLHLHGELMKSCSVNDINTAYDIPPANPDIHIGDKDPYGNQLRPFIVWFGEAVPMIEPAIKIVEQSDILVVIGTSLNVYPAAGLLNYARRGQPVFLIDPKEVNAHRSGIRYIKAGASEGVEKLAELLKEMKEVPANVPL